MDNNTKDISRAIECILIQYGRECVFSLFSSNEQIHEFSDALAEHLSKRGFGIKPKEKQKTEDKNMSNIEVMLAVGVGEKFAIVNAKDVKHILLRNTHTVVVVEGIAYVLNKATTFEESQKVDALFDSGKYEELDVDDYTE